MIWTYREIITLTLSMLAAGIIGGIPVGVWIARIPVPEPPPTDVELGWLAEDLEAAAALIRARATQPNRGIA